MEPAYLVPTHFIGKLIVLLIVAYSMYVIVRLWVLLYLVLFQAPGDEGVSSDSSEFRNYVERARRAIEAIRTLEHPEWETVLSILHEREMEKISFARSAPNTLLLLGLLGTVFGLAETVGSLVKPFSNALNNAGPQEVFALLSFTLRQMGTAFSCTIWGISAALIVSVVARSAGGKLAHTLREWDSYICEKVIPDILPKSQAAVTWTLTEVLLNTSKQLVADIQEFLTKVPRTMHEAAGRFEEVLVTTGAKVQQIMGTLERTAQTMQKSLQDSNEALCKSAESLRISTDTLGEYHNDLRNAHMELLTLFEQARHDLEEQIHAQLKKISELSENFGRETERILSGIGDVSIQLGESTEAFREAGDRFTQEGINIHSQVAHYYQLLNENIGALTNRVTDLLTRVDEKLTEYIRELPKDRVAPQSPTDEPSRGDGWKVLGGIESSLKEVHSLLKEMGDFLKEPVWVLKEPVSVPREPTEALVHRRPNPTEGGPLQPSPSPEGMRILQERPLLQAGVNDHLLDVRRLFVETAGNLENLVKAVNDLSERVSTPPSSPTEVPIPNLEPLVQAINDLLRAMQELKDSLQAQRPRRKVPCILRILFGRKDNNE